MPRRGGVVGVHLERDLGPRRARPSVELIVRSRRGRDERERESRGRRVGLVAVEPDRRVARRAPRERGGPCGPACAGTRPRTAPARRRRAARRPVARARAASSAAARARRSDAASSSSAVSGRRRRASPRRCSSSREDLVVGARLADRRDHRLAELQHDRAVARATARCARGTSSRAGRRRRSARCRSSTCSKTTVKRSSRSSPLRTRVWSGMVASGLQL